MRGRVARRDLAAASSVPSRTPPCDTLPRTRGRAGRRAVGYSTSERPLEPSHPSAGVSGAAPRGFNIGTAVWDPPTCARACSPPRPRVSHIGTLAWDPPTRTRAYRPQPPFRQHTGTPRRWGAGALQSWPSGGTRPRARGDGALPLALAPPLRPPRRPPGPGVDATVSPGCGQFGPVVRWPRAHLLFFPYKSVPAEWFWWQRAPGGGATREGTVLDL